MSAQERHTHTKVISPLFNHLHKDKAKQQVSFVKTPKISDLEVPLLTKHLRQQQHKVKYSTEI